MANRQGFGKRICAYLCLVFLVVLFCAVHAQGQAQTASIAGTATDPSGGAIVGAKVEATNVGTNATQSAVTDAAGRYNLPGLAVGTYNVQASNAGFKVVVHSGVVLAIGGNVVVDFSLPVGQITQTVNVESDVSRVETTSSEVSTLISPQQMRDLPLNGRNFEQLLTLAPGVSTVAAAANPVTGRLYGMQNNYSVSGSRPTGQMFLLDDTDIRDFWEHGTGSGYGGTSLGVEAIGEFQVLTNTYTAEFAGNGAVINATSRSGTNDFHGGAYEFIRNSALDARDIGDPATGAPPFRRNQFGGAVGGPIKKDKLFFFGNFEGLRQDLETTTNLILPEPYTVAGFMPCNTPTPSGGVITTVAGTCVPSTAANSTQPGIMIGQIAGANPLSQQIAALYSLCKGCKQIAPIIPNTTFPGNAGCAVKGCDLGGAYQVQTTPPLIVNENYGLGRVDYTLGTNDSLFGRYVIDNAFVGDPRDPMEIFPETDHTRNQFLTLTERHVFSATLVNSLRFGFVRNNENSAATSGFTSAQLSEVSAYSTALGGPAVTSDPLRWVANEPGQLPRIDGTNAGFNGVQPIGPDPNRPDEIIQNKFSGGDDVTWTHGAHSLKFGVVVTRIQTQNLQTAYADGADVLSYGFFPFAPANANWEGQNWISGEPLVDFAVPPGENNATRYFREIMIAPYFQDDWKVTSRLTLNLGFRYDYDTNPVGWAFGNQPMTTLVGSFLPPVGFQAPASGSPFTPVKHVFARNVNIKNFEPRFGFAFDPFRDHKTSIRGGVGLFDDPTSGRLWESNFINTFPSGFTVPFLPQFPDPCAGGACSAGGGSISEFAGVTYQPHGVSPYQITYNLNLQREVAHGTVLSIGYVGSVSRHLWTQGDINPPMCLATAVSTAFPNCTQLPQIPTSRPTATDATYLSIPGSANECADPNQNDATAPGGIGTGCYGSGANFATLATAQSKNAGPHIYAGGTSLIQAYNTGASAYNSLQVSLNRQFARDLAGQVNYTWSRCVDDGSFASSLEQFGSLVQDRYNERYDYANCTFDIRHNISGNILYALPFKGNRLVEGWQIASIIGIHTGLPLNPTNAGLLFFDPADLGSQWNSRPNYSYAPGCGKGYRLIKQRVTSASVETIQWFDPSCYEAQAPGFLGNVKRDSIPGPGAFSADISVTKNTKITERLNAQFRVECFNCFNHFNVGEIPSGLLGYINEPNNAAGQTTFSQAPVITPRQIQFALKLEF